MSQVRNESANQNPREEESGQTSSTKDSLIQRATVAGCNVPGVPANVIGIVAHQQMQGSCRTNAPTCHGEFQIPGDGRADLVRERPPYLPEIGEIKPASWLGRNLTARAEAQLAGYITAYTNAFGNVPVPMNSFIYGPEPFALNPAQTLKAWGPSNGVYYYSCSGGKKRPRRVPVPEPVPSRQPEPVPVPSGSTASDVATGAAVVGASVGIGYLIYRGVRLIPSLAPPLWWTIPGNLAIP